MVLIIKLVRICIKWFLLVWKIYWGKCLVNEREILFVLICKWVICLIFDINWLVFIWVIWKLYILDFIFDIFKILLISWSKSLVLVLIILVYFSIFFLFFIIESRFEKLIMVLRGVCILWFILVRKVDLSWLVFLVFSCVFFICWWVFLRIWI